MATLDNATSVPHPGVPATLPLVEADVPHDNPLALPTSIELFTGGGGLALGLEQAAFGHLAVAEVRAGACKTLQANRAVESADTVTAGRRDKGWPLIKNDVHKIDWTSYQNKVQLLAAGAPCQPFSIGGDAKGDVDGRNLFPEVLRAVRELRPPIVMIENVRGLTRPSFAEYLSYITAQLERPHAGPRTDESWREHHHRLQSLSNTPVAEQDSYRVVAKVLNAADFGLPQHRLRLFIVAIRNDMTSDFVWPKAKYSRDALWWDLIHGGYWSEHQMSHHRVEVPPGVAARLDEGRPGTKRWRTLRDVISTLPRPSSAATTRSGLTNHQLVPGARLYRGHNGNPIDWPAKTVKAGVHGPPGGEHIVVFRTGHFRYLTVRECARLQGFPDDWIFKGARAETMRQIGNAVPVELARLVGIEVRRLLAASSGTGDLWQLRTA